MHKGSVRRDVSTCRLRDRSGFHDQRRGFVQVARHRPHLAQHVDPDVEHGERTRCAGDLDLAGAAAVQVSKSHTMAAATTRAIPSEEPPRPGRLHRALR